MRNEIEAVRNWHKKFCVPIKNVPEIPADRVEMRHNILQEEVNELHEAMMAGNKEQTLDALCDIIFVVFGTALETGLAGCLPEAFDEVYYSNMSKLDENGNPIVREDGKILKSNLFRKPNLKHFLKP